MRRATDTIAAPEILQRISINALREESDVSRATGLRALIAFQSTLSVRRATWANVFGRVRRKISINALREESDRWQYIPPIHLENFNPRSPWGERPIGYTGVKLFIVISINALREESDLKGMRQRNPNTYFNQRSPWGERHDYFLNPLRTLHFNQRSPWGERLIRNH